MNGPEQSPPSGPRPSSQDPRAYLSAILEAAVEAVVVIDERGRIELFGAAAERMFGYSAEEVVGKNVSLLMPEPDRSRHDGYIESYLRTGRARIIGIGRESVAVRRDGTRFPIELSVGEITGAGVVRRFVGLVRDVTERKQTEDELRRKDRELLENRERLGQASRLSLMGEMAAGLAHEINQPLAAISSYARACLRLMKEHRGEESDYLEALEGISAQAMRAGAIIRRLRAFVYKSDAHRVPTDLNELASDVMKLATAGLRDSGVEIVLETGEDLPRPAVDGVRIQQVLINLLRNGVEASRGSAGAERVVVRTLRGEDGHAQVSVVDQGEGLSRHAEEELFHPFFTTKDAGMGMGLAISRSIVDAHGGRLWFTRNEDRGTTFHFTLPTEPPAPEVSDDDS